ncbi:MAG TPA: FAD-dependent oxidoreductase [Anaerolineales bacterium]|nr:FAD-dependent oxidoreductase [Anaerolineales bacterium]
MKDQARAVVVGGGIMGVSVAYHLAKMGWPDVVLVEKMELATGESAFAAGLVTQFHTSPTLMQIRKYSIELFSELKLFHHVGSLRLASTPAQFKELQRNISQAKAIGLEVEMISADEALKLFPAMTDKELYGAIYLPRDGHLDPYGATTGLAQAARQLGVTIHTGTRLTGIRLSPRGEVTHALTDQGPIRTDVIVNAAGLWGPQVAALAGVHIPSTPVDHQHIALKAVPGHELPQQTPCIRDPDNLIYLKEEAGGLLIGGYELNPRARWIDGVPWEHGGQSLAPDFEQFEPILEGAIRRIPFLEKAEVVSLVCHPGAYTPDSRPILGPVPDARGLWMAAGLSLNGFGGAGGMGKVLAEWIVEGEPSLDLFSFHGWRFARNYADPFYAAERTREGVKYYYYLRFPQDENEWARPRRLSPVHGRLQELGAVFGEKNGWERVNYILPGRSWRRAGADQRQPDWQWGPPPFFERLRQEHTAVRERAGLFDLSSFGKIELEGPGALRLLQRVCDNNLDVPPGRVVYTQFLNTRGGVTADLTITRLAPDRFRVVTGSAFIGHDLGWIQMHVEPADGPVRIREVTDEEACLALWGPSARQILQAVSEADLGNDAFPYMSAASIPVAGFEVLAQRVTYVGELGWELYIPRARATAIWDAVYVAGADHGLEVGGYKVLDGLRLEKGYRYYGMDMTVLETPFEAGLGFCVRLNKGDFIGRPALVEAKARGLSRRLSTVTVGEDRYLPLYGGEAVTIGGEVVGRLRSAGYGFTIGGNIAYTYLPVDQASPGTPIEVEIFGERMAGRVEPDVLVDAKGAKLKG